LVLTVNLLPMPARSRSSTEAITPSSWAMGELMIIIQI
jgi:hypothetical protein